MIRCGVVVGVFLVSAFSCQLQGRDACEGVTCGPGRCALVEGTAACLCDPGFQASGLTCTATPPTDLCASNPCAALPNSLCVIDGGGARCVCPDTRVEVSGSCVLRTACTPNPCTTFRRTTCEDVRGAAVCRCDPGYAPEGDGCTAVPLWTCAAQHVDGDFAEPDECPTLAHAMPFEMTEFHTLQPAGDHDWYDLSVTPGSLVQFATTSTTVHLVIEVYELDGVTLLASDNRGVLDDASVTFLAPPSARVLIRVRAVRGNAIGAYTATYREVGIDDYPNTPDTAVTLGTSSSFFGELQYADDLDVVKLELPPRTAVKLARPADGGAGFVEVSRPDGGTRLLQADESTVISSAQRESMVLTARGRTPRALGTFGLTMEDLGPDDHSDEPAFATPIRADGQPVELTLERFDDVDTFRFVQSSGRIYAAEWSTTSWLTVGVLADDRTLIVPDRTSAASNQLSWKSISAQGATVRVWSSYGSRPVTPFTLRIIDLGVDDHSDDLVGATSVTAGVAAGGRLELSNDVDTFAFTAAASRVMRVALATSQPLPGGLRVRIFDPAGLELAGGVSDVSFLAPITGTYKAQVSRSYATAQDGPIAYSLTLTDTGPDDFPNTSVGTTSLTVGTPQSGSLQYGTDVDVFTFTPVPDHIYGLTCTRAQGSCTMRVVDSAGVHVLDTASTSPLPAFLATSAGAWTIAVTDTSTTSPQTGPYTLTVQDRGVEDHGAAAANATSATAGTPVSGTFGFNGDVDVFAFPVVAGRIYQASTSSPASFGRLEFRNAINTLLATSTYMGGVSIIAPTTGTMYLHVLAGYSLSGPLPYTASIVDVGADDHADTAAGATPLALDTHAQGAVQYRGDLDFFTLPVTGRRHYRVVCTPSIGNCGLMALDGATTLAILSPSQPGGLLFTAPSGVSAVSIRASAEDLSSYELLATDLGADDHGDTLADATALTPGAMPIAGSVPVANDVDVFSVATVVGEVVAFTCITTSGTACALSVNGSSGQGLASVAAGPQTSTVVLSPGGPLRVDVRSGSSSSGTYTLAATVGSDDFTSPTSLTLGTPVNGVISYVGDTDVFEVSLTANVQATITLTGSTRGELALPTGGFATSFLGGGGFRTYTPSVSGTFTLRVQAYSSMQPTPAYTLTVQ